MNKAPKPERVLPSLVELSSGRECPHKEECPCRSGAWCSNAISIASPRSCNHLILRLEGCPELRYDYTCRPLVEIEALASEYLRRGNVHEPPVPVELISLSDPSQPVEIRSLSLKEHHGCTWFLGDEWVIYLNANDPPSVSRYTVFHEAFHIILHSSGVAFTRRSDSGWAFKEMAADYFAASVLMPKEWVYKLWPNVESVKRMAIIFDVPESVMSSWLKRLGLVPTE